MSSPYLVAGLSFPRGVSPTGLYGWGSMRLGEPFHPVNLLLPTSEGHAVKTFA